MSVSVDQLKRECCRELKQIELLWLPFKYTKYTLAQLQRQLTSSSANITPKKLAQLSPFLDVHGIIREGGRLHLSFFSEGSKHPILLPKKSHLTE